MKCCFDFAEVSDFMKKKYQDILMESAKLVGEIPGVNMSTATASVYISAYNDYHEACQFLGVIAANIELINNLESTINKYRNKEDYDIEELRVQVCWYSECVEAAYHDLEKFINERKANGWR